MTTSQQQILHPLRRKKRETRTTIVSFRLRDTEAQALSQDLRERPASGVSSLKQFTRKLCVDYALGKLVYVNPPERDVDSDVREHIDAIALPNCWLTDKKFIKALRDFLTSGENWSQLRFFMLRAGWPEDLLALHRETKTDQDRLLIAQQALTRMLLK